jgi:hypothetical protein
MLPQTVLALHYLNEVGIPRKKFKVVTPYSKKKQRYVTTRIVLYQPFREVQPFLEGLAKRFKVIIYFFDKTPLGCSVLYSATPGLYKFVDRQEVPASVEECTQAGVEQLSLFEGDER